MTTSNDLVTDLVNRFAEMQTLLEEHLADQEGELLPYILMGEIAQWLHAHSGTDPRRVGEIFNWLEDEFVRGDFDTRNLIDVGIVEMLPALPEGATVLDLLGPELRARAEIAGLMTHPNELG